MSSPDKQAYEFGPFRLDAAEHTLWRCGQPVPLRPKVFDILLVLVERHGHLVGKDELMREVWPEQFVEEGNLNKNVSLLRHALGEDPARHEYIETVPKRGYRFVADVRAASGESADLVAEGHAVISGGVENGVNESEASEASIRRFPAGREAWRARGKSVPRVLLAGVVLVGLTFAAVYAWVSGGPGSPVHDLTVRSIAVLPLENLSGDPAQEFFADGMTEAVINELAKIGELRVISRTSAMRYKGASKTAPEIGRELSVDAVVEGSVLRSDNRVRITVQLIRAATDEHLWAESYERDLRDVLAVQAEIARGVAGEIRVKLTRQEQERLAGARPINPAAHEAYLKGLYYLNQAINALHIEEMEQLHGKSFKYFEQAIMFEPDYAPAYAGLARSYHWLASAGLPQFYPKAKEAALKSLAIDDTLAEAHGALAYTIWNHDWDWAGAEREFKRAKELNPNSGNAGQHGYALLLSAMGRHDEAVREMKSAQALDPLILPLKVNFGWIYFNARRHDQAAAQFQGVLELDPNHPVARSGLCAAYIQKGMYAEGVAECQRAVALSEDRPGLKADLAWAYAVAGRRGEAIKILNELKDPSRQKSVSPGRMAKVYAALGERDQVLTRLEEAYKQRDAELLWLKVMPTLGPLRGDPRYADLLRRMNLEP